MVDVTTHQLPWHSTGHHNRQRVFTQSTKLQDVLYEIRGPVHAHAARLEAEGHRILKLNIGNPAPFGFEAPDGGAYCVAGPIDVQGRGVPGYFLFETPSLRPLGTDG